MFCVDDAMRVGDVGQGWKVATSTLMAERSGLSGRPSIGGGKADALVARARATGAWDCDDLLRDDLVGAWVDERVLEMTNLRAFVARRDGKAGAEGSVTELAQSELLQRFALLATHVEPDVSGWRKDDSEAAAAAHAFLYSRAYTIAGGTLRHPAQHHRRAGARASARAKAAELAVSDEHATTDGLTTLRLTLGDGVAHVTLADPARRNALGLLQARELAQITRSIAEDPNVRAVL